MKLVILDRDGVINHERPHLVQSPEDWEPLPGSLEAIAKLCHAGVRVVVATNQSGVGRGLFDVFALNRIHQKMHKALLRLGARLEAVFFCPHAEDSHCACRKPKPGMLLEIGRRLRADLSKVPAIGDAKRDLLAAQNAGAIPVLVLTGKGEATRKEEPLPPDIPVFADLMEAANHFIALWKNET